MTRVVEFARDNNDGRRQLELSLFLKRDDYAMNRYRGEANRLYGVIERRLKESEWLGCNVCTIADIAVFPLGALPGAAGPENR